jgi:hypothetical protein
MSRPSTRPGSASISGIYRSVSSCANQESTPMRRGPSRPWATAGATRRRDAPAIAPRNHRRLTRSPRRRGRGATLGSQARAHAPCRH